MSWLSYQYFVYLPLGFTDGSSRLYSFSLNVHVTLEELAKHSHCVSATVCMPTYCESNI